MKPKYLLVAAVVVLPLLYWLSNHASKIILSSAGEAKTLSTNACRFGEEVCQVNITGQDYTISVENGFSAGQAIQLEVEAVGASGSSEKLQSIHFQLQGKTMYMGISETDLQFIEGKWVGLLRIPFCTTDVMQWQLDMTVSDENSIKYLARYEFEMRHR